MLAAKYRVISHDLLVATIQGRDEVSILLGYSAVTGTCTRARCGRSTCSSGSLGLMVMVVTVVMKVIVGARATCRSTTSRVIVVHVGW